MIIKGLEEIQDFIDSAHERNLRDWYERNIGLKERPHGMRRDIYINSQINSFEKKRIAELEAELRYREEQEQQDRASHEMHLAMGCDDRSCGVC